MNLSFKVLIRFLFSILGQTQPKMVYKTEIFLLLLPFLVTCLYCCWFFKRRLVLVQSKPWTILPPYWPASEQHRNISDRVREPSIKFGNLLVSPYIKTDVAAMSWSTLPIYFYCRFTFQTPRIYEPPLSFTFDSGVYRQIPDTQSLLTENQAAEMV